MAPAADEGDALGCDGGGANATDETRVGIAMNYCAGYIRQQENQQLGIPREVAARFSWESPTPEAPALDGQFGTHVFTKRGRKA